ncbi:TPA: hypothetical protein I7753_21920 [Vibrio vulnificus]|nr:hypothetical protein [Vibrio vulnificus]EIO4061390.1 hypothetical protein [Vibrio vulnificus]EIU7061229.1 hypothetical protein [Vibrio vulnificus]ELV8759782.1 hypothetical protein [Vibrio vulnificus]MCU8142109.1 hypothetical protein [Vibrio vulnificus]
MDIFEIVAEISDATVTPAIEALQNAEEDATIKILLPYNVGGSVGSAVNLITAVDETNAQVVIELDRYAISAAAFIWAWFFLRPKANVTVQTTGAPAVLVYHRPRIPVNDHLLFIDDLVDGHDLKDSLQEATDLFDELFEELIAAIGYVGENEAIYDYQSAQIKHKFRHARDGYYLNQDCVIPA